MAGIPRSQGRAKPKLGPSDSSDSFADRPNQTSDTDSGGTGERATVGRAKPPQPETGTDRIAQDREVGLGGGLDQAEEGQLGVTDEELQAEEAQEESDLVKTPKPKP
jgi:hypothetical protein